MKLTVLIISYRSLEKLRNCVKTIGKNREIIIIENSDNTQIKKIIENEYKNCKVILNNCNLGYAKASNIGFKLINTEYALLLNTDIIINENQINQIEKETVELGDGFTLASPFSDDIIDFNRNNKSGILFCGLRPSVRPIPIYIYIPMMWVAPRGPYTRFCQPIYSCPSVDDLLRFFVREVDLGALSRTADPRVYPRVYPMYALCSPM